VNQTIIPIKRSESNMWLKSGSSMNNITLVMICGKKHNANKIVIQTDFIIKGFLHTKVYNAIRISKKDTMKRTTNKKFK
jgi:hypothetical protein